MRTATGLPTRRASAGRWSSTLCRPADSTSDGRAARRDHQPGRLWRERERADDYRDHAADDEGLRCEWDSGVRPLAQGDAVCDVDRRVRGDHAQGQQRRLCEFVADWRPQDGRDWLPGTGSAPYAADEEERRLFCFVELCRGSGADPRRHAGIRSRTTRRAR